MTLRLSRGFGACRTTTAQELVAPYADALRRVARSAERVG